MIVSACRLTMVGVDGGACGGWCWCGGVGNDRMMGSVTTTMTTTTTNWILKS